MSQNNLLYVYEERIPEALRKLVLSYIPADEFKVDSMTYLTQPEEQKRKLAWADVVLFAPGRHLSDDVMKAGQNIKLMQLWSSGYDKFNIESASRYGIPVANNGGANACSVAEHTVLLMLAVYKNLPNSHQRTVEGKWTGNSHGLDMFLMYKKRVGIIGFGNIGKQVALKISGFGMDVFYYDKQRADSATEEKYGVTYSTFDEIVENSDIITLHLHSNNETKGIIGVKQFSMMKKSAVLINVSRAALVDQNALYEALRNCRIRGAGLDVYDTEPTVAGDRLLNLPNIVATPHMAGSTYDTYAMVMERAVDNFRRAVNGEQPQWVVNLK